MESNSFDEEFAAWLDTLERENEATKQSEQLTADDYAVTINAR